MAESKRIKVFLIIANILLLLFLFSALILIVYENFRPSLSSIDERRIAATKVSFALMHFYKDDFKEENGRFPDSSNELKEFLSEEIGINDSLLEFISDPNGQCLFHDVLDGKGGWYYDSSTGDVRVNLTKPVIYYMSSYTGEDKSEIPSEWSNENK